MTENKRREWHLHTYLGMLFAVTSLLTFLIVSTVFLLTRIPQLESEIRTHAEEDAKELAFRIELQMLAQQAQLEQLATSIPLSLSTETLINEAVANGKVFRALYLLSPSGEIISTGLAPNYRHLQAETLGSDLSATPLFKEVKNNAKPAWSDKYLSSLTGTLTVGLAVPVYGSRVLLAEIPLDYLLNILDSNPGNKTRAIWVVDQRGELIADTEKITRVGGLNIYNSPILNAVLKGKELPPKFAFHGQEYYVGGARSDAIGWSFIARYPAGLDNPEIRTTLLIVGSGFLASLLIGAILALYAASRMLRPLSKIIKQTHQIALGMPAHQWPQGHITEFNRLSTDIGQMADAILERGNQLEELNTGLEARVNERTQALSQAKEAAEAANRSKSTFLANMSHEIRTPLNAISGMAMLMHRAGLPPEQSERLDKLETAGKHLLEVINMVLDLSKIEAGKMVLEETAFELESIFANVCSMLQESAAEKQIALSYQLATPSLHLLGDPTRLQQALLNFASNAVKFTEQGRVTLSAEALENDGETILIRFEVCDTGIGIAPEVQVRLFNAFEQADGSTTRKYGGTGLGLAINAKIAAAMSGTAGVISAPNEGSTFWFTARLKINTDRTNVTPQQVADSEIALRESFGGAHVLLVEDEPINREIAQMLLEDLGFEVDTAEDGQEAVEKVSKQPYDLILMDMQMPRMDGLDATRHIRALPGGQDLLIIAITANAFAEDKERCKQAGMDYFSTKPINPDVFIPLLLTSLMAHRQKMSDNQKPC